MPGLRLRVVVVPFPAIAPGLIVHVPDAGKPFNTTLPVGDPQEDGWVIRPATGAVGATGAALITTSEDAFDIHPAAAVMLKL